MAEVLEDGFGRVREAVEHVLDGLDAARLTHRVGGSANSIAWLVWHLTWVQDDHLAEVMSAGQVWTADGWAERSTCRCRPPNCCGCAARKVIAAGQVTCLYSSRMPLSYRRR